MWLERTSVEQAWEGPSRDTFVRIMVYGQGRCDPDAPYYSHYAKRLTVAEALRAEGVDAVFAEDSIVVHSQDDDVLLRQLELAESCDAIIALQPPEPASGPPTLKLEIADISWSIFRCQFWLFYPQERGLASLDGFITRFPDGRILNYSSEQYARCEFIRDKALGIVDLIRLRKQQGQWPPDCGPSEAAIRFGLTSP